jgi:hypothetical protein
MNTIAIIVANIQNVKPHRRAQQNAPHIKAAHHAMHFGKPLAQPLRKLERPEQQRASRGQTVRQQQPLERRNVRPLRITLVHQKTLVVNDHVGVHERDERAEQILGTPPLVAAGG